MSIWTKIALFILSLVIVDNIRMSMNKPVTSSVECVIIDGNWEPCLKRR